MIKKNIVSIKNIGMQEPAQLSPQDKFKVEIERGAHPHRNVGAGDRVAELVLEGQ